ncbi:hypothetical protein PHYBOEH_003927 [Phytophthora boehmeriae]|uniref:Uncharacterized protein n=1 Tax=Phytophthora boehmeriae TaxID=109152 RepID=A0A8T1WUJ3_9STRA|nr:hypothetical protein PHYBOEH_003927 [Phytophthora boehmeriae]
MKERHRVEMEVERGAEARASSLGRLHQQTQAGETESLKKTNEEANKKRKTSPHETSDENDEGAMSFEDTGDVSDEAFAVTIREVEEHDDAAQVMSSRQRACELELEKTTTTQKTPAQTTPTQTTPTRRSKHKMRTKMGGMN